MTVYIIIVLCLREMFLLMLAKNKLHSTEVLKGLMLKKKT
jgi:hypothetical protein